MDILDSTEAGFPTPDEWDHFVASDPDGHLLQTHAWGELKARFGWQAIRVVVLDGNQALAGAQLLYRKIGPLSLAYVPKGPFGVRQNDPAAKALLERIHALSRRQRAIALKLEPEWPDQDEGAHRWLRQRGFEPSSQCIQPRRTMVVDLTPEEEDILMAMKSKWRYNIRLSIRRDVEVRKADLDEIPLFHDILEVTSERNDFGIHSLAYYRSAYELFEEGDRVALFLAYYEDELLAGLMAYAFNGSAYYMYGASNNKHRELMPNHQLQWRAMQWAKAHGCRRYDLWGVPDIDPDSPTASLSGVGRFKAGFGSEPLRFVGAYDYIYSRPLYWIMRKIWERRGGDGDADA